MKIESDYFIPGRQKGLISSADPFGNNYVGTEDFLLIRVLQLKVSGTVEFYRSSDCCAIGKDCKIALGFSHTKTRAEIDKIKHTFESEIKHEKWAEHLESFRETHCEEDLEMLEAEESRANEEGVENMYDDFWSVKPLNAIRKEFTFIGALEYKDGEISKILFCPKGTQFEDILKRSGFVFINDDSRHCDNAGPILEPY